MTRRVYRCVLGGFVRFVDRTASGRLSQATIQHWLQDRTRVWPRHLILHRARLVDRFLDWAVEHRKLSVNPLAELRKSYSPHTAPIIRALLSADPPAELERIRPVPRFSSHLGQLLQSTDALWAFELTVGISFVLTVSF